MGLRSVTLFYFFLLGDDLMLLVLADQPLAGRSPGIILTSKLLFIQLTTLIAYTGFVLNPFWRE
jgi:hypothetical protein